MFRLESDTGWWLITHLDHAHLTAAFAEHWGNAAFRMPEPRAPVLLAIRAHDDGWVALDEAPSVTREGKPSAFSIDLVGKRSAFEEINLNDYLGVRKHAVSLMAGREPYAALLISMHTCSLLTTHADRTTLRPEHIPVFDKFIADQLALQKTLLDAIRIDPKYSPQQTTHQAVLENFHLLQACDHLSLLTCVDYRGPSDLLTPLPLNDGGYTHVNVTACDKHGNARHFHLNPYPFDERPLTVHFPARHVYGKKFQNDAELQYLFATAEVQTLSVLLTK